MAVAIASGWWLWHTGDARAVLELLRRAHAPALALSVSLLVAALLAKALRWRVLMPRPRAISALEAIRIFYVSILVNNLLPFRLGDGLRIVAGPVRRATTRRQAVAVLLTEGLVDACTLGLCALVVLPLYAGGDSVGPLVRVPRLAGAESTLLLASGFGLVGGAWAVRRLGRKGERIARWLGSLAADVAIVMRLGRRRAAAAAALTVLAWSGTFALHYALLLALGIDGSLVLSIVVTLATNVSMLVPATPANIGVGHAAAAAPLLAWGLPADVAVAYAVLVHAVNTVPPMLIGLACLTAPRLQNPLGEPPGDPGA